MVCDEFENEFKLFKYKITFYDDETNDTREVIVQNTGIIPAIEDAIRELMKFSYRIVRAEEVEETYSETSAQQQLIDKFNKGEDSAKLNKWLRCDDLDEIIDCF